VVSARKEWAAKKNKFLMGLQRMKRGVQLWCYSLLDGKYANVITNAKIIVT
jgi:hypothetical protein